MLELELDPDLRMDVRSGRSEGALFIINFAGRHTPPPVLKLLIDVVDGCCGGTGRALETPSGICLTDDVS